MRSRLRLSYVGIWAATICLLLMVACESVDTAPYSTNQSAPVITENNPGPRNTKGPEAEPPADTEAPEAEPPADTEAPEAEPPADTEAPEAEPPAPAPPADLPDLKVYEVTDCDIVREGSLSGSDVLNLYFRIQNMGTLGVLHVVPFRIESNSGLNGHGTTWVDVSAQPGGQVDIAPQDYDRQHLFRITVDPNNEVMELDESNNTVDVMVTFPPSRPSSYVTLGPEDCVSPVP
jgi:hypothetical protein